jgi:hypothetical protein
MSRGRQPKTCSQPVARRSAVALGRLRASDWETVPWPPLHDLDTRRVLVATRAGST